MTALRAQNGCGVVRFFLLTDRPSDGPLTASQTIELPVKRTRMCESRKVPVTRLLPNQGAAVQGDLIVTVLKNSRLSHLNMSRRG